jgi:hypothetical protein
VIPKDFITEWRAEAPWVSDAQVEQDLVISRAVVELFRVDELAKHLAFRGGAALSRKSLCYVEGQHIVSERYSMTSPRHVLHVARFELQGASDHREGLPIAILPSSAPRTWLLPPSSWPRRTCAPDAPFRSKLAKAPHVRSRPFSQ